MAVGVYHRVCAGTVSAMAYFPLTRKSTTRRSFSLALAGLAMTPIAAIAQEQAKIRRVGVLTSEGVVAAKARMDAFVHGLQQYGYVEGKNLALTFRYAEGNNELLPTLAADLVRTQQPEVIFAPNTPSALAARAAAPSTPIVFSNASDPVGDGLVASLSRPSGNVTGITDIALELGAKRLGLLKEMAPATVRVAVLTDPGRRGEMIAGAADALQLKLFMTDLLTRQSIETRAAQLKDWRADAIYIVSGPNNTFNRHLHAEFALKLRLPTVGSNNEAVEAGTLMSYGPNFEALRKRAAGYVEKILKGARPGDLPIEQPTEFDLAVNLKTAKALGIRVPRTVMLQATRVFE